MSNESVEAFTLYFGSPLRLAAFLFVVLFVVVILALMKMLKNGATELQEDGKFTYADLITNVVRMLAILMLVTLFFTFGF